MYASATCAERTYNLQVERPGQHTASVAAVQAAGTNVHASARYRPSAATRCRAAIERAISKPVQQDTNSNAAEGTGEGRRTFNRPDKLTSSPSQQKRNSHRSQPLTGPRQSVNSAEVCILCISITTMLATATVLGGVAVWLIVSCIYVGIEA